MSDDLTTLQGRWKIAALEMNGASIPPAMFAQASVELAGDDFTSLGMGAVYTGKIALGNDGSHKTITMSFGAGPETGNTNRGVYELMEDGWRFCLNMTGGAAPDAFATKPGDGCALQSLVRP